MDQLAIVSYPHPALRRRSKPITTIDSRLRDVVRQMRELMYAAQGIGLAANQVGLPWQLFLINPSGDPEQTDEEVVFLNPEILRRKGSEEGDEGCLSLPNIYGKVRRALEITVEAYDLEGRGFRMDLEGLPARVVQHEYDHIEGVLFLDRISDEDRQALAPRLTDLETAFRKSQAEGNLPSDLELERHLERIEPAAV